MEVYRTPEERFERLPGFGYQPRYRHVADLRLAHIDEGEGAPVVFLHGEPTWSFLWRNVIPPVRDAGYRCIAPDLVGFGRSDKPVDPSWYSYDRHVELVAALLEDLDLRGATLVVHDWGGPIGLRVAVQDPQRVGRIVAMDTGVFTGHQPMSQAWHRFADFVARTQDLPIGLLVRRGCATDPGDAVVAAYEAPFPEQRAKAGAKAFPALIPLTPEAPGAEAGQQTFAALCQDRRPMLLLWAEEDRALPQAAGEALASALGRPPPRRIVGAGHYLQEDKGPEIGAIIAEWLAAAPA